MDMRVNVCFILLYILSRNNVFGARDILGYMKSENAICAGESIGQYNHTGTTALDPDICRTNCLAFDGCIAISVDHLEEICLFYSDCSSTTSNGVYTTYEAVGCGDPPGLANGRPTVSIFYYNYPANYACFDDYELVGLDSVMCDEFGDWTGNAPTCEYTKYNRCEKRCSTSSFSCPSNMELDVIYANYGHVEGRNCTDGTGNECLNYESNDEVKAECNGIGGCNVNPAGLSMPSCVNASSYLLVEYICVDNRTNLQACYAPSCSHNVANSNSSFVLTSEGAQREYVCDPGYEMDNESLAVVLCEDGIAVTMEPLCNPINCPEIVLTDGMFSTNATEYLTSVSFNCQVGYEFAGTNPINCQADATWSGNYSCSIVDCGMFMVADATIDFSGGTTYNSTVTIQCDTGYLSSPGVSAVDITCESSGNWSDTAICTPVDCGSVPSVDADGYVDFNTTTADTLYNSTLTYNCNSGFVPEMMLISCNSDGNWSTSHVCNAVQCPDPASFGNLTYVNLTDSTNFQSVATVTCDTGFEFPNLTATCEQSQQWSPAIECRRIMCPYPSMVAFSSHDFNSPFYGETAVYTCDTGYEISDGVTSANATCEADGLWSGVPASCTAVDCGTPAPITTGIGQPTYTDTTFNSTLVYVCAQTYELVGDSEGTCTESKTWSIDPPVCNLITCPTIPAALGQAGVSNAVAGTSLTYSCDDGYNLEGSANITCLYTGEWDYDVPTCERVNCSSPATMENTVVVSDDGELFEDTVVYECVTGYEQSSGDLSRQCQADATWSGTPLSCSIVSCGPAPDDGLNVDAVATGTEYNDTVTYTCHQGYKLEAGSVEINRCTETKLWLQTDASDCEIMDCGDPGTVIENGNAAFNETTYGSSVVYTCNEGFLPFETVYDCNENEVWDGTAPTCEPVNCSSILEDIDNGVKVVPNDTLIGHQVLYSCNNGYTLNGEANLTCTRFGNWSAPIPACDPVSCGPVSETLENGAVTVGGMTFTETVGYTCDDGYHLNGSSEITCTETASWSADPPACLLINQVRILTYVTSSLDCDDYTEASLQTLLTQAQMTMPAEVLALLATLPDGSLLTNTVVIVGISCNSPLRYLIEVVVNTTEDVATTEDTVTDALDGLTTVSVQLQVDGDTVTVDFSDVSSSVDTATSCGQGYFTNVATLECTACAKDTYQPTGVPELCLPCPSSKVTEGSATYGDEADVCDSVSEDSEESDDAALILGLSIGVPLGVLLLLLLIILVCCATRKASNYDNRFEEADSETYDARKLGYRYNQPYGRQYPYKW